MGLEVIVSSLAETFEVTRGGVEVLCVCCCDRNIVACCVVLQGGNRPLNFDE